MSSASASWARGWPRSCGLLHWLGCCGRPGTGRLGIALEPPRDLLGGDVDAAGERRHEPFELAHLEVTTEVPLDGCARHPQLAVTADPGVGAPVKHRDLLAGVVIHVGGADGVLV